MVTRGNPLMEEILDAGLPYISGPQWLRENVLAGSWVLAVAGTHGKTTTASMLAWILEDAGLAPGFLIGGVPDNFGVSARRRPRTARFFVVEADEYDTAFFDKRSKFLHYPARTAILNNLEFDHADIFPDLAAIETQFHHFVRTLPANGLIVANGADEALARVLARGCWTRRSSASASPTAGARALATAAASRCAGRAQPQGRVAVAAHRRAQRVERARRDRRRAPLRGRAGRAIAALGAFRRREAPHGGARRRPRHHGLRRFRAPSDGDRSDARGTARDKRRDGGRILAVLEPRSNTMKAGALKERLAASLAASDLVFCYSAGLAWDAARCSRRSATARGATTISTSSSPRSRGGAAGRPRRHHEQRRLRRHPRASFSLAYIQRGAREAA